MWLCELLRRITRCVAFFGGLCSERDTPSRWREKEEGGRDDVLNGSFLLHRKMHVLYITRELEKKKRLGGFFDEGNVQRLRSQATQRILGRNPSCHCASPPLFYLHLFSRSRRVLGICVCMCVGVRCLLGGPSRAYVQASVLLESIRLTLLTRCGSPQRFCHRRSAQVRDAFACLPVRGFRLRTRFPRDHWGS